MKPSLHCSIDTPHHPTATHLTTPQRHPSHHSNTPHSTATPLTRMTASNPAGARETIKNPNSSTTLFVVAHKHTCTQTHLHTHLHIHSPTHTHAHTPTQTHTHKCTYRYTHTNTHPYTPIHTFTYTYVCWWWQHCVYLYNTYNVYSTNTIVTILNIALRDLREVYTQNLL